MNKGSLSVDKNIPLSRDLVKQQFPLYEAVQLYIKILKSLVSDRFSRDYELAGNWIMIVLAAVAAE